MQIVYLANLLPTIHRFGAVFSKETLRFAETYGPHVAEYMGVLAAGPTTFTHGDYRLDNMFFGEKEDFAVIDWQVSGVQSSLYDVAYFLATSVSSDVRRQVEREALKEYHDVVRGMGVRDFTFEECWRLYRDNIARPTRDRHHHMRRAGPERRTQLPDLPRSACSEPLTAIEDLDVGRTDSRSPTGSPRGPGSRQRSSPACRAAHTTFARRCIGPDASGARRIRTATSSTTPTNPRGRPYGTSRRRFAESPRE